MFHQYRVTKYDPAQRSPLGTYQQEDWTSQSDIGKSFAGETLTEERYLAVEEAYLEAAESFLNEAGVRELHVVGLENPAKDPEAPSEGSLLQVDQVKPLLRSLLRERYWCKLESSRAFVHVGYDYYMYIGVPDECADAKTHSRSLGLFVESFRSPYLEDSA